MKSFTLFICSFIFFKVIPLKATKDFPELSLENEEDRIFISKIEKSLKSQGITNIIFPSQDVFEIVENQGEVLKTKSYKPLKSKIKQRNEIIFLPSKPISKTKEMVLKKNGEDGRRQITETQKWPHSVHGVVHVMFPNIEDGSDSWGWGTGIFIGPNIVLTAGHNLYDFDNKFFASEVSFFPAMNGKKTPFGSSKVVKSFFSKSYEEKKENDWGILILENPIGYQTGYFGLSILPDLTIKDLYINVTGYPGDKKEGNNYGMWGMGGEVKEINKDYITYEIDTFKGQSGSGVWHQEGGNYYVTGIHVDGIKGLKINQATRLTMDIYKEICRGVKECFFYSFIEEIKSGKFSNIQSLDLSGINITYKYMPYLSYFPDLETLNLSNTKITSNGMRSLVGANSFDKLLTLKLHENNINYEGVEALLECSSLESLRSLSLGFIRLEDEREDRKEYQSVFSKISNKFSQLENLRLFFKNQNGKIIPLTLGEEEECSNSDEINPEKRAKKSIQRKWEKRSVSNPIENIYLRDNLISPYFIEAENSSSRRSSAYLTDIWRFLEQNNQSSVLIMGSPLSGKETLVLKYAQEACENKAYEVILNISFKKTPLYQGSDKRNYSPLTNAYKYFLEKMEIEFDTNLMEKINEIKKILESKKTLLILQSLDKKRYNLIKNYLPSLSNKKVSLLITSEEQLNDEIRYLKKIEIKPFKREEAIRYFEKIHGERGEDIEEEKWKILMKALKIMEENKIDFLPGKLEKLDFDKKNKDIERLKNSGNWDNSTTLAEKLKDIIPIFTDEDIRKIIEAYKTNYEVNRASGMSDFFDEIKKIFPHMEEEIKEGRKYDVRKENGESVSHKIED